MSQRSAELACQTWQSILVIAQAPLALWMTKYAYMLVSHYKNAHPEWVLNCEGSICASLWICANHVGMLKPTSTVSWLLPFFILLYQWHSLNSSRYSLSTSSKVIECSAAVCHSLVRARLRFLHCQHHQASHQASWALSSQCVSVKVQMALLCL